jgi:DNA modification methylase
MFFLKNEEIDAIVTSPPYLNAIDYMRGHRLALVWLGHSILSLRTIRSSSIGAERTSGTFLTAAFADLLKQHQLWEESSTTTLMIQKYFMDLCSQLAESYRVLKFDGFASYVIGNSEIKGRFVPNSALLTRAADLAGFLVVSEEVRDIPDNRRYMPITGSGIKTLSKRMRTEHILTFVKRLRLEVQPSNI